MEKLSETSVKLVKKLKALWNDRDFVNGVMNTLKTEEERKVVLDFIEHDDDVTSDRVILLSLRLKQQRVVN